MMVSNGKFCVFCSQHFGQILDNEKTHTDDQGVKLKPRFCSLRPVII